MHCDVFRRTVVTKVEHTTLLVLFLSLLSLTRGEEEQGPTGGVSLCLSKSLCDKKKYTKICEMSAKFFVNRVNEVRVQGLWQKDTKFQVQRDGLFSLEGINSRIYV